MFIQSTEVGKEREDLFKLLLLADVFALPSYLEGLPISLLEAMALGKVVISTNVNGIPEAVRHLETGWLIEPGAVGELVEAIQTLKDDWNLREKLAQQGSRFVSKNFDESVAAQTACQGHSGSFSE